MAVSPTTTIGHDRHAGRRSPPRSAASPPARGTSVPSTTTTARPASASTFVAVTHPVGHDTAEAHEGPGNRPLVASLDCAGAQPTAPAGRARACPRHARALRHRVRQRRLLDLLRARPHGRLRARADAARLRRRRASSSPPPPPPTPRGRCASPRPAAPPASPATPSTSSSPSAPPGRRCSSTSSPSPPRRSSSRTTSRSSGSRCARTRGTSSAASSSSSLLVVLNIVGVQEAARLSITLAVIDFATQVLLVALGFVLVFSPEILVDNIHWGVAPTWSNLAIAIPVAMLAYTGVETVSNLAEEVRDPVKNVPDAYKLVARRRLRDLLHAAADRSLGAAGRRDRRRADDAAGAVAGGGRLRERPDPRRRPEPRRRRSAARGARDLRRHPRRHDPLHRDERRRDRRLADHLRDGDVPADPGGLPAAAPALQDAVALDRRSSPASLPIAVILPGDVNFVGTLYSFGATLSFTIAHASLVRMRMTLAAGGAALPRPAEPARRQCRLAALRPFRRDRDRRLVRRHRRPEPGHALGRPRLDRRRPRLLHRLPAFASSASR